MMEYCPCCGTKLNETNYGQKYCPNHGIIYEEEKSESEETPSYVG